MKKLLASLVLVTVAALGLAACSAPADPVVVDEGTVVVDVRTPGEYAQGHLTGAINLDIQSAAFDSEVKRLPIDATYVIYCQSGNRAGTAVSRMAAMGFSDLKNAGGIADASKATGLAIVTAP